jgi:UDP-N-acetylmuramyl pentapeptide phosphotransferase/UDP-N-acetylglucosamine-1-phosphate transferase
LEIFGSLVLSFLISYVSIPSIIRVAQLKHLYDDPDDYICSRKIHSSKVPTLGGVAIFAGFLMSFSFFGISLDI